VEIGDAILKKELPLVVGVLADLSGNPEQPLPKLRDRKFVEIDRDNLNDVLAACAPRLTLRVDNKLSKEPAKLNIELKFRNMEHFTPLEVMQQVESLKKLYQVRQRLTDLLGKLDGNDALDAMLQEIAGKPDAMKQIQAATQPTNGGTNA
jgi:type VI secretion system protein ImpB